MSWAANGAVKLPAPLALLVGGRSSVMASLFNQRNVNRRRSLLRALCDQVERHVRTVHDQSPRPSRAIDALKASTYSMVDDWTAPEQSPSWPCMGSHSRGAIRARGRPRYVS